jgi:predicted dehydrogenase
MDHWSNAREEGGRFPGEGVHFLDLCNWFFGMAPVTVFAQFTGEPDITNPNLAVTLGYPDSSLATIIYTTHGNTRMGKEYYEVLGNGRSARCEDFKDFEVYGLKEKAGRGERGDKGYRRELEEFHAAVTGSDYPIPGADARAGLLATRLALAAVESGRYRRVVDFNEHCLRGKIDPDGICS